MHTTSAYVDDKKDVETNVEKLRVLMVTPDAAELNTILAPQLSYGHSGGRAEGKDSLVESLVSGKSDFLTIELIEQTVSVIDNLALVRHTLNADTHDKGKSPAKISLKVLLVWMKKNNAWELVARQAVRL